MKAIWKDQVIAESDDTIVVENNHYFPPSSVKRDMLAPSETSTHCHWKGDASYYHVKVGDDVNEDAAWYYPDPLDAAAELKDHVAFWRGVKVVD